MKDIKFLKDNGVSVELGLELLGDVETYNSMLVEFENGYDNKINQIKKYYANEDFQNYSIYTHALKSDCKYFGFMKLAELAYEHEKASKENNVKFIKDNYAKLLNESEKIKSLVDEYLEVAELVETVECDEILKEDIILIADDSQVIRQFVTKIFDADYAIEVAEDGQQALDFIKQHQNDNRIKAILLDLMMPEIDGFAVLDYLTENKLISKIPVTIISGDSSKEAIDRAFKYGIVDMINKPFSEEKIKQIVERTINS